MSPTNKPFAVVHDANVLIGICAKEQNKQNTAKTAVEDYLNKGYEFFAPSVIVSEVIFVLCKKLADGLLTQTEYDKAIESFKNYLTFIFPAPKGESALIDCAVRTINGYGCSRSSDGLYIALVEELSSTYNVELLTFDKGIINQVAKNAPTVKVNLLPI